jgi:hypothetical protein
MTRRDFFRFIVLGGLFGLVSKKLRLKKEPKKAMFWTKQA